MPSSNTVTNPSSNAPKQVPTCFSPRQCMVSNNKGGLPVQNGKETKILVNADSAHPDFGSILSMQRIQKDSLGNIIPSGYQNLGKDSAEFKSLLTTAEVSLGYIKAIDSMAKAADVQNRVPELKTALDRIGKGNLLQLDAASGRPIDNLKRFAGNLPDHQYDAALLAKFPSLLANGAPVSPNAKTAAGLLAVELEDADDTVVIESKTDKIVNLSYPVDALYSSSSEDGITPGNDYIRIERFEYKPPQADTTKNNINAVINGGMKRGTNLKKFIGLVKLPIPNDLNVSNGVDWGGATANPLEAATFFQAREKISAAGGSGLQMMIEAVTGGFGALSAISKAATSGGNAQTALSAAIAKFALSKVGINVDPAQFITRETGQTLNPNLELLFSGPKLRNFAFRFDFAPNSEQDASESRKIQRFFREGMLPQASTAGESGVEDTLFLGSPDVFRISYFNGATRIRGLPIHKICALTQCAINFTDQGVYQSYHDQLAGSSPVRSQMILSFTELTPLFREDYTGDGPDGSKKLFGAVDAAVSAGNNGEIKGPLMGENKINEEDIGF